MPEAVALDTAEPLAVGPAKIWTVTGVVSLAKPLNDGAVSLDGETGWSNATVGELVSTVNVTGGSLRPVSIRRLVCVACAVYTPSPSGAVGSSDHVPSDGGNDVPIVSKGVPTVVPS